MTADAGIDQAAIGPLANLRVLELATLNAGPTLGAILGDLGADVVKVEPPGGDELRVLGPPAGGQARPSLWTLVARNKRVVTLDYKQPDGQALLARMTAVADVVVLNQPRPLLERIGCTYEAISARNPRAVVVQVSGWGDTGPYAELGGNGTLGEAFAGLTDLLRHADGVPRLSGALLGDNLAALAGVIGTLAACYSRDARGGEGQFVDVALYEAVLTVLGSQVVTWDPEAAAKARPGEWSGHGIRGTFRTADDRWVAVTAYSDAQLGRLLAAVGVEVPGAPAGPHAPEAGPDLGRLVEGWIGANDVDTVLDAFRTTRIGIAPVNDIGALLADPHALERHAVLEVEDPDLGKVRVPHPTPRLSRTPGEVRWVARALGADNDTVYAEWIGLRAEELQQLREAKIV